MQQLIEFSLRHWELALAFIAILGLLLGLELRDKLVGIRALSPQEITLLINRESAVVLDIRSRELFNKGHIAGSINTPFDELSAKIGQLAKHKSKSLILVHAAGQPLAKCKSLLKNSGFAQITYLKGGISTWQSAGLPLVKAG